MITHNFKVKIQTVNDQMDFYRSNTLIDVKLPIDHVIAAIRKHMTTRDLNYLLLYMDEYHYKYLVAHMESMAMTPSLSGIEPDEFGYVGKIHDVNIITDAGSVEKYINGCKLLVSDFPIILNAELMQQRKMDIND